MKRVVLLVLTSVLPALVATAAVPVGGAGESSLLIQTNLTTCLPHVSPCTTATIPELTVTVARDGRVLQTVKTGADGGAELNLPVGTYQVSADKVDGACPDGVLNEDVRCGAQDVAVNAGAATVLSLNYALLFP